MKPENAPIYSLRTAQVFQALESSPQGLSDEEAAMRLSLYGPNSLIEPPSKAVWPRLVSHLAHPMALVLWAAGALASLAFEPGWTVVIWTLVIVNAGFSYWREYRAEQAMAALSRILPVYARVARGGAEEAVLACELVPGDVLILAEGDNIPADARVVEEFGLRTNNSTLTGEAVPARKTSDASLTDGVSELERPNLIFAGTSVVSGTGRAVIFSTGMLTQFGRIARLTQQVEETPSALQVELQQLTRKISLIAFGLALIVFFVSWFDPTMNMGLRESFLLALGIFVAVVPEGLSATITLALAMAGQRLAQHSILVKKLATIETLGMVSVICTDKSGTLTQNQMTVRDIWVNRQRLSVSGVGYDSEGDFTPEKGSLSPGLKAALGELVSAGALCNNSRLNPPTLEHPHWTSLGDQTEVALTVTANKAGIPLAELFASWTRIHELPFDARRKRMSTIHRHPNQPGQIAFVKGAPREVIALCTHVLIDGQAVPLDARIRAEVLEANDEYASRALRVLALARRELSDRTGSYSVERIEQGLTLLGLMGMMDPPRPEVAEAVKICRQAGIRIVMITGDYGLTAASLARRIGLVTSTNPLIFTGTEIDEMSDVALANTLSGERELIFARMAPEHKLRLVAGFQSLGEVVAVTGDGVNDAPALRKADVGMVMGIVGTDVAKEAADLIITNDNFISIVRSIEEGRAIYDNLRKFITYIFASNVPEVLPFLVRGLFSIPLALTFKQILAIDLGTDLLPALALGTEKPEPDIMQRPPRSRSQPLVDRALVVRSFLWLGLLEAGLCYLGFFLVYELSGYTNFITWPFFEQIAANPFFYVPVEHAYELAITVFFVGVVMAQVGNAFACRTERLRNSRLGWLSNRSLLQAVLVEVVLVLALVYFPPLQEFWGHEPVPLFFFILLPLYAPLLYTLEWIRKLIVRRR